MEHYVKSMNDVAGLMEFLGQSRWEELAQEGSKYYLEAGRGIKYAYGEVKHKQATRGERE